jgi:lipoprotein-anchoring transpeptidase ErfK/SrfK
VRLWRNAAYVCARSVVLFAPSLCFAAQTAQADVTYHLESTEPLSRFSSKQRDLLEKLNRADGAHLSRLKRLVVPNRWDLDQLAYSPMPNSIAQLLDAPKALVVDLPAQVFGAYESGILVRWGPVSSGGPNHPTPSGHYHLNWNARIRISSENDSWIMPWYFNFDSNSGFGLHEYTLPGRPASHGCVRLLRSDAKWLFYWGQGWTLIPESGDILRHGTLVTILGRYDFTRPQPWLQPAWWSRGVTLSDSDIDSLQ